MGIDKPDVFCERCGKNMMGINGSLVGVSIQVSVGANGDRDFIQLQLGKYVIGKVYQFCFECFIDTYKGET